MYHESNQAKIQKVAIRLKKSLANTQYKLVYASDDKTDFFITTRRNEGKSYLRKLFSPSELLVAKGDCSSSKWGVQIYGECYAKEITDLLQPFTEFIYEIKLRSIYVRRMYG